MKRAIILLTAVMCILLTGCSPWLHGYVSVTPHLEQRNPDDQKIVYASNYEELCSALTNLIDTRSTNGVISVMNYPENQRAGDITRAVYYARNAYPMGAYAVSDIRYEVGTNAGMAALAVSIDYQRLPSEMDQVQPALGMEGAKATIYSALNQSNPSVVMKVIHFEQLDFTQVVEDYANQHPEMVMETPEVAVSYYPQVGSTRIVEIKFTYQTSRESLKMMQSQVEPLFTSAKAYVSGDAEDHQKYLQLYSFLMKRFDYQMGTSITPSYSLLMHGVGNSKAFATVFASMCRNAGLECIYVTGTKNGEPWNWNIIRDGDQYYHTDLLYCLHKGAFQELTDEEMEGYVWDFSAYPACEGQPEDTEKTSAE